MNSFFNICLSLTTLFLCNSTYAQLSGSYSVGTISSDYLTLTDAVNDLNANGVNGPTIFNLEPGIYSEQVEILPITGSSTINTVIFQSVTLDSTDVEIIFNTIGGSNHVVKMNGCDHVTLKHMSIISTGDSYATVIYMNGGSNYNTISNCIISNFDSDGGNSNRNAINIVATPDSSNWNKIVNNRFDDFYCAVNASFNNTWIGQGLQINDNILVNGFGRLFRISYQDNFEIKNNYCEGYYQLGIDINNSFYVEIDNNEFVFNSQGSVLDLSNTHGTNAQPIIVKNNFFGNWRMNLNGSTYIDIIHNNFLRYQTVINFSSVSLNHINIYNNILQSGLGSFYNFSPSVNLGNINSNYNCFYSNSNEHIWFDWMNQLTITEWQDSTGHDLNSVFTDPLYVDTFDLHVDNPILINNVGYTYPGVTNDFDGDLRSSPPDIGADEFDIDSSQFYDIAIVDVLEPDTTSCLLPDSMKVRLVNNSSFDLDTFTLKLWSHNYLKIDSVFLVNIPAYDTLDLSLGAYHFVSNTFYHFSFELSLPNNQNDNDMSNNNYVIDYYHLSDFDVYSKPVGECSNDIELYIKDFPRQSVVWSTSANSDSIIVNSSGTYSVQVEDDKGCISNSSIIIP